MLDMDINKILARLGQDETIRTEWIAFLKQLEARIDYQGSIRDELTGPILDALCANVPVLRKTLQDGTQFQFYYRSKIARDFLLCEPATPQYAWEPQTSKLLCYFAEHARQALVGGAYFGDQAILMAKIMAHQSGVLHAFEPNQDQLTMLLANASLNALDNIVAHPLGLWSDSDVALKLVGFDSFAHPEQCAVDDADSFATISVDDYCEQQGVMHLDLIALDLEGAEYHTLLGAKRVLAANQRPQIVFEVHRHYVNWDQGLANTEICRYLANLGYHLFAIRDYNSNVDMQGRPVELIPVDKVYLDGPPHGFNMLAVTSLDLLQQPLFAFCENVSPKLLPHRDPTLHAPLN